MNLLEQLFPGLRATPYLVISPRTHGYNCIAWAAGDDANWWWPTNAPGDAPRFWPDAAPREDTLVAFVAAFATLGFALTDIAGPETGFDKVALFADAQGVPTHAARQLPSGLWTSKLGQWEDIEHELLALEGGVYGRVHVLLKRPISN